MLTGVQAPVYKRPCWGCGGPGFRLGLKIIFMVMQDIYICNVDDKTCNFFSCEGVLHNVEYLHDCTVLYRPCDQI